MAKQPQDCRHEVLDPVNGLFCCICGASVAMLLAAGTPVHALIMPYPGARRYLGHCGNRNCDGVCMDFDCTDIDTKLTTKDNG